MQLIDVILLIIIMGFSLAGLWFGLIHTVGSLFGTVFGVYLASRYYEIMATWLVGVTGWEGNGPRVLTFVLAFFIINRLVGLLFWFLEKIFSILTRLPFIRSLDRFLGLLLGFFEGFITVGIIIFFIERYPLAQGIMQHIANSTIAPYASRSASIIWPLLPEAMRIIESTVDYVEKVVR